MEDYSILIVDDDPNIISSITRLSKGKNFKVAGAHSANEALLMMRDTSYDLLIVDEKMPGMKGSDFIVKITGLYPGIVKIMLTGHPDLDLAVKLINQGDIYRFFSKPCNSSELFLSIQNALEYRELLAKSFRLMQIVRHQEKIISSIRESKNEPDKEEVILPEPSKEEINEIKFKSFLDDIDDLNKRYIRQ